MRTREDLPEDVRGEFGFTWPSELYLQNRIDKQTAIDLARMLVCTPPGMERELGNNIWPGFDKYLEEIENEPSEDDESDSEEENDFKPIEWNKEQIDDMERYFKVIGSLFMEISEQSQTQ